MKRNQKKLKRLHDQIKKHVFFLKKKENKNSIRSTRNLYIHEKYEQK